jgi:hypothetical protein
VLLDFDRRLTRDENHAKAALTHVGMAHFAGTGPAGKVCRECKFWREATKHQYYTSTSRHGPTLKPVPCAKFTRLTGKLGPGVPHGAQACKHFEAAENPPPIKRAF